VSRRSIEYRRNRSIGLESLLGLYRANDWSAAEKPVALRRAIEGSDCVVSAWDADELVGLGNALTDGALVVYYPHLLVAPSHQGRGVGRRLVAMLQQRYAGFHQQVLVAEGDAIAFYQKCGFSQAGRTRSMWIYQGEDH
jgi:GNAT superfamily N-acetyltransferase